ncbi:MAG: hypothetical protein QMD14_01010 [Candidatus Aenigmarchaeota archaeon]|nr:hypothetical protein [Candidatus Aenigmarchaeota archaeon]
MRIVYLLVFLLVLGLVIEVAAEVIVVQPHITIIPPFSPQHAFPTITYSFDFTLKNDGSGDASVSVTSICPPALTCSLSGFTSGNIIEDASATTTLNVRAPYPTLPGNYIVGINATYDDVYNFAEVKPNFTLSNITFIVKRAKLHIQSIYIENITQVDSYWVLVLQDVHDVVVRVSNSGNLDATDILFIWNLPADLLIENVEYYSTMTPGESRAYKFHLIPTTLGNYTINFTINYTTSYGGSSLIYSERSPLFNLSVKDKPIFNPPPEGDIRNNIGVSGDLNYLNIFWNASFIGGSIRSVNVTCWLSCDPRISDCTLAQSCRGFKLKDICTIFTPGYNSTLECTGDSCIAGLDGIICQINDTEFPAIGDWANLTFRYLNFDLSLLPEATFTVGTSLLPIHVTNKGLLKDTYNFSAVSLAPHIVGVELLEKSVENLSYGESGGITAKLSILVGESATIYIRANSTTNSQIYKAATITIRAGYASLPDLDFMSLLQIILLAGIIFYFFIRNPTYRS